MKLLDAKENMSNQILMVSVFYSLGVGQESFLDQS